VELAHLAHEAGLECYVSAALRGRHMREATLAAIDGVGVGTSLHYIDAATKLMGALRPESIMAALQVRDEAAREPFAQCSRLLARMDRMHANAAWARPRSTTARCSTCAERREAGACACRSARPGWRGCQAMKPDFDVEVLVVGGGRRARGRAEQHVLGGDRLAITADSEATDRWQELVSRIEHVQHAARPAADRTTDFRLRNRAQ
jgi:hypothetical protein